MESDEFYDEDFFRAVSASGARALRIIMTKRWASRPRDLVDIEWLTLLSGRPK